jgi:hypothetical protein
MYMEYVIIPEHRDGIYIRYVTIYRVYGHIYFHILILRYNYKIFKKQGCF